MAGFITLPMFEVSARPFAERLADWLERVATVHPDAGAAITTLRAELARTLAQCLAERDELADSLDYLASRVHVGQQLELSPIPVDEQGRPSEGPPSWFAGYRVSGDQCATFRAQSLQAALLGLSGFLEAKPWIGSPNPALHYSNPPASSQK